jgi:hypothetical protein
LLSVRHANTVVAMVAPARAVTFLSGALGAVATLGSGTAWLYANVPASVVYLVALIFLGMMALTTSVLAFRSLAGRYKLSQWWLYILAEAAVISLAWLIARSLSSTTVTEYVMAYVFVGVSVIPVFWLSFQLDNVNHKECAMCCERIKARARVCRHCGSQLEVRSSTD